MHYDKTITLKDGRICTLRNGTAEDGQALLDIFNLTHAQTDYLLTYPEESTHTAQQEADYLQQKAESSDGIELLAELEGKVVGTAGIDCVGRKEKTRHRAEFGISVDKAHWGLGKRVRWFIMIVAMLFLLTGCGTSSAFDGSQVSNASEFQMVYSVLNREETAALELKAGEQLRVALSHTEGTVDVIVGIEGKAPIYRGNGQQNAEFDLEIAETGNYHISVSGHRAKGNITFTRVPGGQE